MRCLLRSNANLMNAIHLIVALPSFFSFPAERLSGKSRPLVVPKFQNFAFMNKHTKNLLWFVHWASLNLTWATVLKNWKSLNKNCLDLWLVWSENLHFLVSEMLCVEIFSIWPFEKINFKVWNIIHLYFSFNQCLLIKTSPKTD